MCCSSCGGRTGGVYLLLGVGLALTGVAFLAWSGKGATVDMEGLLIISLIEAVPITLGALVRASRANALE